jgi:hypothetical protein
MGIVLIALQLLSSTVPRGPKLGKIIASISESHFLQNHHRRNTRQNYCSLTSQRSKRPSPSSRSQDHRGGDAIIFRKVFDQENCAERMPYDHGSFSYRGNRLFEPNFPFCIFCIVPVGHLQKKHLERSTQMFLQMLLPADSGRKIWFELQLLQVLDVIPVGCPATTWIIMT